MRTLVFVLAGVALFVPARPPGPSLVHVAGPYRVLYDNVAPSAWSYADPAWDLAFTLSPGAVVEVTTGGTCRIDGRAPVTAGIIGTERCAP